MKNNNPILNVFNTKHNSIPFDKIKLEHFLPAIKEGIKEAKKNILAITEEKKAPTFSNTIED